ncbi:MAG: hypothetical protein M3552_07115 [Planctomycetota bacterium]|nr:hypothetical protein [Planctomycetaceae bacterium]MDQ3330406.1 hypothetical protein [Planctomycetota bacterium]
MGLPEIIILVVFFGGLLCALAVVGASLFYVSKKSRSRMKESGTAIISHSPAMVDSDGTLRLEVPLGPEWADRWVRVVVEPGDRL